MSKYEYNSNDLDLSQTQLEKLELLRNWVLTEAEFYGRSENEFLVLFLSSCNYDVELTKTTITSFYKVRRDNPEWWGNTFGNPVLLQMLNQRVATLLINNHLDQPAVALVKFGRLGVLAIEIDEFFKAGTFALQMICLMRWKNVTKNDVILIVDFKDYDLNFLLKMSSPAIIKKFVLNFYTTSPIKFNKFIGLNVPYILKTLTPFVLTFFPSAFRHKVVLYGSEWPKLTDHVPSEILPAEFGGEGPPLKYHEDSYQLEVRKYDDYMEDDLKWDEFGECNKTKITYTYALMFNAYVYVIFVCIFNIYGFIHMRVEVMAVSQNCPKPVLS